MDEEVQSPRRILEITPKRRTRFDPPPPDALERIRTTLTDCIGLVASFPLACAKATLIDCIRMLPDDGQPVIRATDRRQFLEENPSVEPTDDLKNASKCMGLRLEGDAEQKYTSRPYSGEEDQPLIMELLVRLLGEAVGIAMCFTDVLKYPDMCHVVFEKTTKKCVGVIIAYLERVGKNCVRNCIRTIAVDLHVGRVGLEKRLVRCMLNFLLTQPKMYGVTGCHIDILTSCSSGVEFFEQFGFIRTKWTQIPFSVDSYHMELIFHLSHRPFSDEAWGRLQKPSPSMESYRNLFICPEEATKKTAEEGG